MIRQLILFLATVANSACVWYGADFAYLPVFRAQEAGAEFDVRMGQKWRRQYAQISNGTRLLQRLPTGL